MKSKQNTSLLNGIKLFKSIKATVFFNGLFFGDFFIMEMEAAKGQISEGMISGDKGILGERTQ